MSSTCNLCESENEADPSSPTHSTSTEGKRSISGSSDYESQSSDSPSVDKSLKGSAVEYAAHKDYIDSNDTLRVLPPPPPRSSSASRQRPSSSISTQVNLKPLMIIPPRKRSLSLELRQPDIEPAVAEGVSKIAAQSVDETLNTKRTLIASLKTPQESWSIMQGKEDEKVEKQFSALGLQGLRISQDSSDEKASEISRTPSQSTTGTIESSNIGSFGTKASSLQSGSSSHEFGHIEEKDAVLSSSSVNPLTTSSVSSPILSSPPPRRSSSVYHSIISSSEDVSLMRQQLDPSNALRRYHALLELVETERGYAEDLSSLVHVFFYNLNTQSFFQENEARLKAVCRNADHLLELHTKLALQLSKVIDECELSAELEGTDLDKAFRCDEAVIQVANKILQFTDKFECYQTFCARHAEALVLIREAEKRHNGDDFASFERLCGTQLRGQRKRAATIGYSGNSIVSSRRSSLGTSTPLAVSSGQFHLAPPSNDDSNSAGSASGTTTPSGSFASISRQTSGRLLFADYLIKPIQRLCLYPLVLNSLLKYTPEDQVNTRKVLESAIIAMRQVADDVDKASKQREQDLMGDLLVSKIEMQPGINQIFLKSLGNPRLSGSLDVHYHHDINRPLMVPIRFHRLGVIVWDGFLLLVRIRKNQQLDCKYWIPLSQARISSLEEQTVPDKEVASWGLSISTLKSPVPFPLRLSYFGHHFEMSASSDKERQIWHQHLTLAIDEAPSSLPANSSNLSSDLNSLSSSGADSVFRFLSLNSSNNNSTNSEITPVLSVSDNLFKFPSASNRAAVDRNMIFSTVLLSQYSSYLGPNGSGSGYGTISLSPKDVNEALVAQQLRQNAPPSIGSAVGAAMGLARMAATTMPNPVKRARRQSMLNLTEISPACDALLIENGTAMERISSREIMTKQSPNLSSSENGDGNTTTGSIKWRNGLFRRGSRVFGGKSPSGSVQSSPFTSTTDLSQTIQTSVPIPSSPEREDGSKSPARQPPSRSRTMSLRDMWSSNFGAKRNRSDSVCSEVRSIVIDSVDNQGLELVSPGSNITSLDTSPPLDLDVCNSNLPSSRRDSATESASIDLAKSVKAAAPSKEDLNSALIARNSSPPSKSIAQLRRILSTSSSLKSGSNATLGRANTNIGRMSISNGSNGGMSNTWATRRKYERSQTELIFPTMKTMSSAEPYLNLDRRSSETDATLVTFDTSNLTAPITTFDYQKPSFATGARSSFRKIGRRTSLLAPATTSLSGFNGVWEERLKAVVEVPAAESNEGSLMTSKQNTPKVELKRLGSQKAL